MAEELIRRRFEEAAAVTRSLLAPEHVATTRQLAEVVTETFREGGKVLLCGNGGSAADAMHVAAELVGRYRLDRPALPAISLSDSQSVVTCVANDHAFEQVFARGVRAYGREGDVLLALSTSGTSANVIAALEAARELGVRRLAMTGASGGGVRELSDVCLCVPSTETARIQEGYMLVAHTICELVETALFGQ